MSGAAVDGKPSFLLSQPVGIPGDIFGSPHAAELRLLISKPDDLVGEFFDELFTAVLIVGILGVGLAVSAGLYLRRSAVRAPVSFSVAPIVEAVKALARKDFSYRMGENLGGQDFAAARVAFNQFMDNIAELDASRENYIRARLIAGESERRAFQTALGSVREGVLVVDHLGKIVVFNQAMQELSGFDKDVVLNKAFTDIVTLSRRGGEKITKLIPQMLSTGVTEVFPEDTMLRRRDGTLAPVSVRTTCIKNDLRGGVTHLIVIMEEQKAATDKSHAAGTEKPEAPGAAVANVAAVPIPAASHRDSEKLPMISEAPLSPGYVSAATLALGSKKQAPSATVKEEKELSAAFSSRSPTAQAAKPVFTPPPPSEAKGLAHSDAEKLPQRAAEELPMTVFDQLPAVPDNQEIRAVANAPASAKAESAPPLSDAKDQPQATAPPNLPV